MDSFLTILRTAVFRFSFLEKEEFALKCQF
jgi:hypothetical protein